MTTHLSKKLYLAEAVIAVVRGGGGGSEKQGELEEGENVKRWDGDDKGRNGHRGHREKEVQTVL